MKTWHKVNKLQVLSGKKYTLEEILKSFSMELVYSPWKYFELLLLDYWSKTAALLEKYSPGSRMPCVKFTVTCSICAFHRMPCVMSTVTCSICAFHSLHCVRFTVICSSCASICFNPKQNFSRWALSYALFVWDECQFTNSFTLACTANQMQDCSSAIFSRLHYYRSHHRHLQPLFSSLSWNAGWSTEAIFLYMTIVPAKQLKVLKEYCQSGIELKILKHCQIDTQLKIYTLPRATNILRFTYILSYTDILRYTIII